MPYKGVPYCDCVVDLNGRYMYRDYWLVKECYRHCWIQCKHCGKVRKTFAKKAPFGLKQRPANWRELLDPFVTPSKAEGKMAGQDDCSDLKGKEVDHKNKNTLDNRRANLEICTKKENLKRRY